jgi:capsular polysaccharide biosynthesis protein
VAKQEIDIRTLALAVRRRWRTMVVGILLGALGAVTLNLLTEVKYEGRSSVLLQRVEGETNTPSGAMATDAALAHSVPVATRVVEQLGLPVEPTDFLKEYTVSAITDDVLQFRVKRPTAEGAAAAAEALAEEFLAFRDAQNDAQVDTVIRSMEERRQALESQLRQVVAALVTAQPADQSRLEDQQTELNRELGELKSRVADAQLQAELASDGSQVVEPAQVPRSPVQPKKSFNLLVGVFLGAVAAVAVVTFSEIVSDRVRSRDEIASAAGAPVVASAVLSRRAGGIRRLDGSSAWRLVDSPPTPIVRALDAVADSMGDSGKARFIMASVESTNEAAVLTAALGNHLNQAGLTTTLVELSSSGTVPLATFLDGAHRLDPGSQLPTRLEADDVLFLHPVSDDGSQRWKPESVDRVVVGRDLDADDDRGDGLLLGFVAVPHDSDLPNLSDVAPSSFLVVAAGRTTSAEVSRAANLLRRSGAPVSGVVVVQPDRFDRTTGQRGAVARP